ncbi:glycosyl hydrolase family 28-related protein [Xanthobacteraceae bacterium Astr-EGSB]|uniref:glycosyl hydrolase family 28-related protein n=1 Tax=Astrobacterium formosum TaxID=3069710 RepID=UPI0027B5DF65|nr:glycosyl hydrolase family 28-related protein [Xanthobacteraceae bacterium Astr-EGSB]
MIGGFSRRTFLEEAIKVITTGSASGRPRLFASPNHSPLFQFAASELTDSYPKAKYVDVLDFGADPTGTRDSSDAVTRAVEKCLQVPDKRFPQSLYFPSGRYLLTRNNCLRPAFFDRSIHSWLVHGDGPGSTIIEFRPAVVPDQTDYYIYDGAACLAEKQTSLTLMGLRVAAVQFIFDCSQLPRGHVVNAFRQCGLSQSSDPEQYWTFEDCYFLSESKFRDRIGAILKIIGDANGSENAFMSCRARFMAHVIHCTNPQAVNHASLNCHWELFVKDLFCFVRGGNIVVVGGSIIVDNFERLPAWRQNTTYLSGAHIYADARRFRATNTGVSGENPPQPSASVIRDGSMEWELDGDESIFLLRVGGDVTGQINTFYVSGCRIELRSQRAKLLAGGDLNTAAVVVFDSLAVQPVIGGFRHTVEIAESRLSVHFRNCKVARASGIWDEPFAIDFGPGPDRDYPRRALSGPRVLLDGCEISEKLHELCRWQPNSTASLTVLNANIAYHEPPRHPASTHLHVVDGTVSAPNTVHSSASARVPKYVRQVLVPFSHWPVQGFDRNTPTDALYVTFPPQTVVDEIVMCRSISSGSSTEYRIAITDVRSGELLYESDTLNFRTPFRIITPRLFAFKKRETLEIAIWGSAISRSPVPVAADDFIAIQCF